MTGRPQDSAKSDWEDEGGAPGPEPKQTTPKGLAIPVPKRSEVMDAFRKIIRPKPKPKP